MSIFKKSDYNILVSLFLKEPRKINYPKEYAIAKKLLLIYPDFTFWKSTLLQEKYGVLNSLAYFLTQDGKKFIKFNYNSHVKRESLSIASPKKSEISLQKNKVGESLGLKSKRNPSLIDFIKNDS